MWLHSHRWKKCALEAALAFKWQSRFLCTTHILKGNIQVRQTNPFRVKFKMSSVIWWANTTAWPHVQPRSKNAKKSTGWWKFLWIFEMTSDCMWVSTIMTMSKLGTTGLIRLPESYTFNVGTQQSHTVECIPQVCVIIAEKEKKRNSSKMICCFKKKKHVLPLGTVWHLAKFGPFLSLK